MNQADIYAALPLIILSGTGLLILLWSAFASSASRIPFLLTIAGAGAAAVFAGMNMGASHDAALGGLLFNNGYSNFFTILFCAAVILTVLLAERYLEEVQTLIGEFCALILFSSAGMVMMASGADLLVIFLGLETMSIAFYVLAGFFRSKTESNEAALKYFLLGAFATGFFLYGIALIYGSLGSMNLIKIASMTSPVPWSAMLVLGLVLLIVGFAFKVAAFPFHQWAPDVYEGSPTIVAGFMSTAGKAAAFSALIVIFSSIPVSVLSGNAEKIQIIISVLAALSMLYGNIVALSQTKIKRMLAYSSTAHAGYLLLGVASLSLSGAAGVAIYAAVYLLMQIAAFGIVAMLERETGSGLELTDFTGLAKKRPYAALLMAIIMLSLAGIPPFAGFFGKYYLFLAAINSGMTWLAIVGVISSIIASYFYLRVIVLMYFRDPVGSDDGAIAKESNISYIAIGLASVALIVLGLMPGLLTDAAGYVFK
ncbi:MAG: NADH-quinone oxidoreductase subunit N [Ignavibacteriota bacterium]